MKNQVSIYNMIKFNLKYLWQNTHMQDILIIMTEKWLYFIVILSSVCEKF